MTRNQAKTIAKINAQHEAQRWEAQQAARDVSALDAVSVLYAIQVKIAEGRIDEAKQMYNEWKKGH